MIMISRRYIPKYRNPEAMKHACQDTESIDEIESQKIVKLRIILFFRHLSGIIKLLAGKAPRQDFR